MKPNRNAPAVLFVILVAADLPPTGGEPFRWVLFNN